MQSNWCVSSTKRNLCHAFHGSGAITEGEWKDCKSWIMGKCCGNHELAAAEAAHTRPAQDWTYQPSSQRWQKSLDGRRAYGVLCLHSILMTVDGCWRRVFLSSVVQPLLSPLFQQIGPQPCSDRKPWLNSVHIKHKQVGKRLAAGGGLGCRE